MADDGDDNVIDFPRIGFTPPGGTGAGPGFTGPSDGVPRDPAQPETEPAGPVVRRSPLEALAALPAPGPQLPTGAPMPAGDTPEGGAAGSALQHGFVPEALRGPGYDDTSQTESAGLGALSMAAVLAVAVAALRGIHTAVTNRRATREQRQAVADAARRSRRTPNASGAAGASVSGGHTSGGGGGGGRRNIPAGHDWARRSLNHTGPSGGRGPGGSGAKGTGGRNESPGRRRNNGGGSTDLRKAGLFSRSGSGTDASGRRGDRKDRDRVRRDRLGGGHKTTQSGDAGSRLRLRRPRNPGPKNGPDSGAPKRGPGAGQGRGGRRKPPTGTTGPKGTLRAPKNSPRRSGQGKASRNTGPNTAPSPKAKAKNKGRNGKAGGPQRRVTLRQAITAEAERRLRKRRKHMTPAISVSKKRRKKNKTGPGRPNPASATTSTSTSTGPTTSKAGKVNRNKSRQGPAKAGRRTSPWDHARRRIRARWAKRRAAWNGGAPYTAPPYGGGPRRSPFQAAGMAGAAAYGTTYTVERIDNPGDQNRRWEPRPPKARPAAGAIPPPRPAATPPPAASTPPGTGAPTSTKGGGMTLPANTTPGFNLTPSMTAEHTTEVTLDDTLEVLEKLTSESFGAHDESVRLAAKAKELRAALEDLAADLQSRHNVIGRLTGAAMARLAESMDVLARKAEQMAVSSLAAAEMSEGAEQAMFDAYKPVQQATADAGLAVPSARVHNEG